MMLGANCDLRVVPVDAADGRIDHQPLVLVVDDDAQLRNLLARWLRAAGYPVQVAGTAEEALVTQLMTPVAVAVCDIGLPGEDGVWLATQFRERFPDTAVVMMTGAADVDSAVAGVRLGVVDYLRKPLDRVRVCAAVARGIGRDHGWTAHDRHPGRGETETGKEAPQAPGIDRLLSTIARCHADAVERTRRVGNLAIVLARRLRIPDAGLCVIGQAALLYKLRSLVPAAAPEPSRYAASTEDVVGGVEERFDGRGPRGLKGAAISPGSRVVAVAHAYDALLQPGDDQPAMTPGDALASIERASGTRFDPRVVDVLADMIAGRSRQPAPAVMVS